MMIPLKPVSCAHTFFIIIFLDRAQERSKDHLRFFSALIDLTLVFGFVTFVCCPCFHAPNLAKLKGEPFSVLAKRPNGSFCEIIQN